MSTSQQATIEVPTWDEDFWSDQALLDPYPVYEALRELGPVVWLSRHEAFAFTWHDTVKRGLLNAATYSSAQGVMMNEPMNHAARGIMLTSDDPEHMAKRQLFQKPLMPKALAQLRDRLTTSAAQQVDLLVARGTFDAVSDLAHFLPLAIVTELVGLDEEGRENMLEWAAGIFNAFGPPDNARTEAGLATVQHVMHYVVERLRREDLVPGGWGSLLFEASDRGELSESATRLMLVDYLSPALDTTINATSSAIELFASYPEQWDLLRADRTLIPRAIDEVVRIESPVRAFSRLAVCDAEEAGIRIPAGSRVLMLYACANRDDRRFENAAQFDITRNAGDHVGFGMGTHLCAGRNLAKLEISIILEQLLDRVKGFTILETERRPHNTLRGLHRLVVAVR